MDLSKPNDSFVFDNMRKSWMKATPEERVRQELIQAMITSYGYPKEMIGVEMNLSDIPHLQMQKKKIPDRRIDIVCFAKNIHKDYPLYPLLLIECKQDGKLKGALDQILGYNHYVGACFIAVATTSVFLLQFLGKSGIVQKDLKHPPLYKELIQAVQV